jgi:hypothetical protein
MYYDQDDVLVLGGVHAAAQGVGHPPELGFVADVGGSGIGGWRMGSGLWKCELGWTGLNSCIFAIPPSGLVKCGWPESASGAACAG